MSHITIEKDHSGRGGTRINGVRINFAAGFRTKEAIASNAVAARLLGACAAESIERRADAAFGIQRDEDERQQQLKMRMLTKKTRRTLTDAIKDWCLRQNDPESNRVKFAYINASETLNVLLFGAKAKKLCEQLECLRTQLRDRLTFEQLRDVEKLEDTAVILIDDKGYSPSDAIKEAYRRVWVID